MAEKNTFSSIQAGLDSISKSNEGDSLMKGRTYIPRLSPDTRQALIKALRDRRKKKADKKMASRKAASDDFFANEADKAMDRYAKEKKYSQVEDRLLKDRSDEMINKYEPGGKTKKYRK